jgi:hypothetical protein
LIYQRTNQEPDRGIAAAIDQGVRAARRKPSKRKPKRAEKGDGSAAGASRWLIRRRVAWSDLGQPG